MNLAETQRRREKTGNKKLCVSASLRDSSQRNATGKQQTCCLILLLFLTFTRTTQTHAESPSDSLRLNQIQVIGSHNSFKAAIEPELQKLMVSFYPDAKQLDYAHPPLTDQLNLGLRGLELDIYNDPAGGHYANPLGLKMLQLTGKTPLPYDPDGKMKLPGFKVMHVQDIDFRSNCFTLVDALEELRAWSNEHPRHLPVIITCNLTDATIKLPGSVTPVLFDKAALDALDQVILTTLGKSKLIRPDDIRVNHATLLAAVLAKSWPTLAESRGRFLFVLDTLGHKRTLYLEGHPSLRGRSLFVDSRPGDPAAAILIRNNPLAEHKKIADFVRQGYLVRTRADSGTLEARRGDMTRFEAAMKSGAQVISTDYYTTDWRLNPNYQIRFEKGRCVRQNPVTQPDKAKAVTNLHVE